MRRLGEFFLGFYEDAAISKMKKERLKQTRFLQEGKTNQAERAEQKRKETDKKLERLHNRWLR